MAKRWRNNGNSEDFILGGTPKSLQMVTAVMKLKDASPWKKSYDQPRQHIKKQRHYLPTKVRLVKAIIFPVVMYECESWTTKKAEHWRIDAFELCCWRRLLRVPWTARRSNQSIKPKRNQSWISIGRTDAEAETPILWLHAAKSWLIRKGPDAGKDRRQKEKGMTEDKVVGWHHRLNGQEFEQALWVGDGQDRKSVV